VLILIEHGRPIAQLCDFGRSKIVDNRGFITGLAGNFRYMAPELLHGAELGEDNEGPEQAHQQASELTPQLTKESDVYGFGMVALMVSESVYTCERPPLLEPIAQLSLGCRARALSCFEVSRIPIYRPTADLE
jgi:serine/threonine protein kinase